MPTKLWRAGAYKKCGRCLGHKTQDYQNFSLSASLTNSDTCLPEHPLQGFPPEAALIQERKKEVQNRSLITCHGILIFL